ncbi:MAG: tetratricopeptide repeat protein, partial [Halioglobus sp.]
ASRYSSSGRVPEFLRTHPLSENRIADTRNRARQYPKQIRDTSLDYQLMRARVSAQLAPTPEQGVLQFRGELDGTPRSREAATYGLVLALTAAGRPAEAREALQTIWSPASDRVEYVVADAEIDMASNRPDIAADKLESALELAPGNHPLTMAYATALMQGGQPHIAEQVLLEQSKRRPNDPSLWYLLAEVQGLAGHIAGLHQSRAEYFILNGALNQAERQLNYALKLVKDDYPTRAKINQRIADVREMRIQMESF